MKETIFDIFYAGDVAIFKTMVQVESRTRDLFYICEPTMTLDNPMMRNSLESQKSELTAAIQNSLS